MIFPVINTADRPDRLSGSKDKKYHVQMARWALKGCNNPQLLYNIYKYIINWNFYKGNQWIFNEDLEQFLMDDDGDHRNRIRWCYDIVSPLVNYYVGTAIRTNYSVRGFNTSPFSVDAKRTDMSKRLKAHDMAAAMPLMADAFKDKFNLGNNPQETEDKITEEQDNDYNEVAVNEILRDIEQWNRFDYLQMIEAQNIAIAGLAILKDREHNGRQRWDNIDPAYYFYDTSGSMPDHSDCEYQGDIQMVMPTYLYESVDDLTAADRKRIEDATKNSASTLYYNANFGFTQTYGMLNGKIPKYNVYWHDTDIWKFGYVRDAIGTKRLARIYTDPEDGFTSADLLGKEELTTSEFKKVGIKGYFKRRKDIVHYCEFIPSEVLGGGDDIVCEYGEIPYAETYTEAPFESPTPYKVTTYDYRFGEIITPLDKVISPQRMMNRFVSMMESTMNNAGGTNIAYDQSVIPTDGEGGNAEADFNKAIQNGKPLKVNAARWGGNVQNAVVKYDATNTNQALGIQNATEGVRRMTQNSTGVNEFMNGTTDGTKVLKSVAEGSMSQGSIMQERFFNALAQQFFSVYKCAANKGRRIYCENEIRLKASLGGKGIDYIQLTRDMAYDEMGITLRRVPLEQTNVEKNNALLIELFQLQLIGDEEFAKCFNRAELDEVAYAIRAYSKLKAESAKQMQEQDAAKNEQAQADGAAVMQMQNQKDVFNKQADSAIVDKKIRNQKEINKENGRLKMMMKQMDVQKQRNAV